MCDRYQISDRAGAAIANAVIQDYGIITPDEDSLIIDRNKLRRSRFSVRKELANEAHETINDISVTYLITEPPFTKYLSKEVLINSVLTPIEIPGYPCHTQAVERTIQLVTKSSCSVT